ncbi:MAG: hypothetical protein A2622_02745 [Bdellovibrionales bacterium RIFCSPHIGHO2_01_FULL_40_29]|nr:MAG: hypothetical protein A2622_02745 [Bdellovibrionales bacterium RIFCSPHIGHO2_01_FULL_40_29]OFZ33996.1 MAG: hypothetical protein A3D17_03165 [Bdellovibrionales bacterium RIFCSPHIGHO2_02_FULL_40_15]
MSSQPEQTYEKFGKYVLLEKIAAGGMAEVYLAKSAVANGLNKFVALKRILPQFFSNEEFIDMFKEEAKVAINLNHGNVVSIYDFGIEKKQFYLVMEFVEGRNLRQVINELKKNNKSFSIDQSIFIIKEVAAGLDHAHRCVDANSGRPLNITHRDMSPQNIMVSFEGEVKVIDFGIAKAETEKEETKAGTLKGKFSYMSPEQAEGQPIDPRTDIFALGIVLWELLANDRLFTGSNEAAILRKVRDCQIPLIRKVNPLVPQELERIVMKALAKDRNVRYQTAANLHRDLNRFLNMQYPDFSSQDFSSSLKESFKVPYLEAREKLIHYAKVDLVLNVPELTMTATATAPAPIAKAEDPNRPPVPDLPIPPGGLKMDPPVKINLDGVLGANIGKPAFRNRAPGTALPNSAATPSRGVSTNAVGQKTGVTYQTRLTQLSQGSFKKSYLNEYSELAGKLLVFALVIGGGFWAYNNHKTKSEFEQVAKKALAENVTGQIDMSGTAAIRLSVASTPSGAQIFIDGKDSGYTTPAIVSITANKNTMITLKKDGYLNYEVSQRHSQTGRLAVTMQASAQAAYVNIYVLNGGTSTKIYVNGKELSEQAPVLKYPILANMNALIRAYNPITRQSDELRMLLKPGQTKKVELILGRNPASNKK